MAASGSTPNSMHDGSWEGGVKHTPAFAFLSEALIAKPEDEKM